MHSFFKTNLAPVTCSGALLLASFILSACEKHYYPSAPFSAIPAPQAPDYASPDSWAAWPTWDDYADTVPVSGLQDEQASATADVFFIHPTTYNSEASWNADIYDEELNHTTDTKPILHQASIFNAAGRIFAPRYRQATLGVFHIPDSATRTLALDTAYRDVRRAFRFYLERENKGRPIIIVSHSQGTVHAMRLLKEFFEGKPLQKQLVAAYLAGWPIPRSFFTRIPPCESPDQTECWLSWCTLRENFIPEFFDTTRHYFCVNPVTWTSSSSFSTPEKHKGLVLQDYNEIQPHIVEARVQNGLLWIKKPKLKVPGAGLMKNYHIADYNLFWLDIRQNAELRVDAFMKKR